MSVPTGDTQNSSDDMNSGSGGLARIRVRFDTWRRSHPRMFQGLLAVVVVGLLGIGWYLSMPEPNTVKVYMQEPGITDLTVEKPRPDPLIVEFGDSVAQLEQINKTVTGHVELSPNLPGKWSWRDDRRLVFTPQEDWGVRQSYSVRLDKKLFPSHVLLDRYHLSFQTPGFSGELLNTEFHQDPAQPKIKKFVSTVRFTHHVDQDDFRNRVKLIMKDADPRVDDEGKDLPFQISFNKTGNEAYIQSDPVSIPLKAQTMILTVDDGARSKRNGVATGRELTAEVSVPGMYSYFRVAAANVTLVRNDHNEPEQVLIVETTDGVREEILRDNLELFLLPLDRPASSGRKAVERYYWNSVEEIGPEILKLSTPLTLEHIPAEHEFARQHSFKINTPPERHVYVRVKKGIQSAGGYILANTFDTIKRVPVYPREIEIMGKGALLSLAGDNRLSIVSRGNAGLLYEVGYVLPSQIQHLVTQSSGDFQNPTFANYRFDQDNIIQRFVQRQRLEEVPPGKSQYTSFDFSQYLNHKDSIRRSGVFLLTISGWDFERQRRTNVSVQRLVLVTDLGLLVKQNADRSRDVFVISLRNGQPVHGADVIVMGKNGLPVFNGSSDTAGHVYIPDLHKLQREKQPTAIYAARGNNLSFMPYDRADRRLDLSRFDIGGVRQHGRTDALSAYLFSDRGIYRPGDSFNIGMIIKSSDWKRDLTGIPLQTVITDPRGLVIREHKFALSASGFESLSYNTRDSSPTGEYEVKLYVIKDEHQHNLLGSTTIKLEEFLPDRMNISARFSKERALGWVHPKDLNARVNLKNLYGTPATQRRISASMILSPYSPVFRQYSAFRFYDPLKANKGFTERLPDAETDNEGEAEIPLNLERFDSASYSVTLQVNGFEAEGGRSVSTERNILVSPRDFLIGYKADGKLDYVSKDSERTVRFIAIDPELKLTRANDLQIELIEQRYVSALVKQDNGTYKYQSVLKEKKISESPLDISNKGLDYPLPTKEPGDYILLVRDAQGTELNRLSFNVAGEANLGRNLEKNAELQIKLDKRDYEPGDPIQVSIRAPYIGAGIITIERDRVYGYKWFKTDSTSSVQTIRLPAGIEGNAYVNVSFIRDLASPEIFMSPLSYGIAPFTISRDARRNKVSLEVPYLIRPGETVDIQYQAQHPGKIVVFAVDEGILQVANYQTPQPLQHFFRKRALEVDTAQILDMILPEYSVVREVAAAGGGMEGDALSRNLNPFKRRTHKPVAFWSGILNADGKGGKVSYTVPDHFNGTLRFMAVAVSSASMGVAEEKSLARGHFVLSPNVPTFVAPDDSFDISLNIANNVEKSGQGAKVRVKLLTSEHLQVLETSEHEIAIDEGREKSVQFRLRALPDKLGSASLRFVASTGGKESTAVVDLSLRPPVPYQVDVTGGYVRDDEVERVLGRDMYPQFRTRDMTVAAVPLGLSRGMLQYLDEYPHLCTEQLVSKVFPILALRDQQEFGYDHDKAQASIDRVVDVLRARQNGEGAFGFWAANAHVSPKQSLYALHFLQRAHREGFVIPESMLENAFKYAMQMAQKDIDNLADARVRAYALYLLTDKGVVTTRLLNDMREKMDKFYRDRWQQDISRAYMAAAYKLLHLDDEGDALIDDMQFGADIEVDYPSYYDDLSRNAQLLYLLSRHFPERLEGIEGGALETIVTPINQGYFNTLSSSYSIIGLDAYADRVGTLDKMDVSIKGIDQQGTASTIDLPADRQFPLIKVADMVNKVILDNETEQPVFYQITEAGFDRAMPTKKIEQGLEIHREYRTLDGKQVDKVSMGEELNVHLQIRSIDGNSHYNVAIVDLLPGGFELVRDASRQQNGSWQADYRDLREDRIVLYGTVSKQAQEFVYRIKANNRGRYAVAPPYAESMYNRQVRYRGLGTHIAVE